MARLRRLLRQGSIALALIAVAGASAQPRTQRILRVTSVGGGTVVSDDGRINCGTRCSAAYRQGALVTLTVSGRYSSFDQWRQGCVGTAPRCIVALDHDTTVRALSNRYPATINVTVGGQGTVVSEPGGVACGADRADCVRSFDQGTTVTLHPALGSAGVFDRWGGACHGATGSACRLFVRGDAEVSAAFRDQTPATGPQTLMVTVDGSPLSSEPPGIACPPTCLAAFESGTPATLSGSGVYSWEGACVGVGRSCAIVVDGPVDLAAREVAYGPPPPPPPPPAPGFGINVSVSGRGIVFGGKIHCGGLHGTLLDCEGLFRRGSTVVLEAAPVGRSRFARWSGFCQGKKRRCSLRVTAPKIVTALFR